MSLEKWKDREIDQLFAAVLELRTMEDCYKFFDDLCTVNEIKSMAQRLEVARMLGLGYTYCKIEEQTGASTATISREALFKLRDGRLRSCPKPSQRKGK